MKEFHNIRQQVKRGKKIRVAINGFGRIGKMILRASLENSKVEIVAINQNHKVLLNSIKYDTTHGIFPETLEIKENYLIVGTKKILLLQDSELKSINWGKLNIDVVAECTGKFTNVEDSKIHIKKGAKKVLISAPAKGNCFFFVRGVNDSEYIGQKIVSNGSCTTNSVSAILNELHKKFKIKKAMFATIHSVTGDQKILDGAHKDLRRARAGCFNIVPTTTGAANAITKLIPSLSGKIHGIAYRVPTISGSVTDLNLEFEKKVETDELNIFFRKFM